MKKALITLIPLLTFVLGLHIGTINGTEKAYKDFITEDTEWEQRLVGKQEQLIIAQQIVIDKLAEHCWKEHSCEIPTFDGDDYANMLELQNEVDSIYTNEL